MLPVLRLFFCGHDLFRCEVIVRRSSASNWMGRDEYRCTRLVRIYSMASSAMGRPSSCSARAKFRQSVLHVLDRFSVSLSVSVPFHAIGEDIQQWRIMVPFPCWHIDCVRVVSVFRECERIESYLDRGVDLVDVHTVVRLSTRVPHRPHVRTDLVALGVDRHLG